MSSNNNHCHLITIMVQLSERTKKILKGVAVAIAVIGLIVLIVWAVTPDNSLEGNPLDPRGHLFGSGFKQYDQIDMSNHRTLDDLEQKCHKKCVDEDKCGGFHYRLDDRSRGQWCWFYENPIQWTAKDSPQKGVQYSGVWIKK